MASIRRIISDDDAGKPAAAPPPAPAPAAGAKNSQDDIDAMLAGFDEAPDDGAGATEAEIAADVLELTEAMQASARFSMASSIQLTGCSTKCLNPNVRESRKSSGLRQCWTVRYYHRAPPQPLTMHLIRWRTPSWCKTHVRLKTWYAKCLSPCSRRGSMTICPTWWNAWYAPRSSGFRGGEDKGARASCSPFTIKFWCRG